MKQGKKKFIFKVRDKKIKGYLVRVISTVDRKLVTHCNEMFCIQDYGNKKKLAMNAAMRYRDSVLNKSGDFSPDRQRLGNRAVSHKKISARNRTGVTGVQFKDMNYFHGYIAAWQENGKTKTKAFSTQDRSKKKAFKLAKAYRDKMVLLHYRR